MAKGLFANNVEYARARFLIASLLLVVFVAPGAPEMLAALPESVADYWKILAYGYYVQFLTIVLLVLMFLIPNQVPLKRIVGRAPSSTNLRDAFTMAVFLLLVAWASVYLVFWPLSFVLPDFVDSWLLDSPSVIHVDGNITPFLPNALQVISICVAAPILEEIIFRGLILHRLTQKRRLGYGVFWSSLIFALLHSDFLGAFLFGIGMCALYVRTRSLLVPILCHCVHNLLFWLVSFGLFLQGADDAAYGTSDFQDDWRYGALAGLAVLMWSLFAYRRGGLRPFWIQHDADVNR